MTIIEGEYYVSGRDNDVYVLKIVNDIVFVIEHSNRHDVRHLDCYTKESFIETFDLDCGITDFMCDLDINDFKHI